MRKNALLLVFSLGLLAVGGSLSLLIQTNFGKVHIEDVRFPGPDGIIQNARLFVPDGVTDEDPAPGIVAIHGYINTHETQAGFAIEFARRGYVVLAVDQTGHGYSDPPSGANGFGGPPALEFLRTLGFVDQENIGLEGHSMGGWAVQAAAASQPQGYRSLVLQGASVGARRDTSDGSAPLRNTSVVFSLFDEFSGSMWGVPIPKDIVGTEQLKGFFDTEEDVVPGRVYGSIEEGDARVLHQPPVTHPGDHLSRAAIGHAVDWFQQTLDGGNDLSPSKQIWYWKEIGTLLALLGLVLLLLAVGGILLETPWFAGLKCEPEMPKPAMGWGRWAGAAVFILLPVLTLFPFIGLTSKIGLSANTLLPQGITNQVITWTTLVGLISMILFVLWHLTSNRARGATWGSYGLTLDQGVEWKRIGKSLLLALIIVSVGHLAAAGSAGLFKSDFRFWVFAVRPLDSLHARISLPYAVPFIGFLLVLSTVLHGQFRKQGQSLAREMAGNVGLLVSGFAGLLVVQYVPLLLGGTMTIPSEPLWTIISFQFIPIMTIVAVVTTFFFRRTGMVYVGGFVCGLLVTWTVVASQATHIAL